MSQRLRIKPKTIANRAAQPDGRKLVELAQRVAASNEPPTIEIEVALQAHLSAKTIPAVKPTPSAHDKHAVQLALLAFAVLQACEAHLGGGSALDPCVRKAWPGIWGWLQFLDRGYQGVQFGDALKGSAALTIRSIIAILACSEAVRVEMASTPGVATMVAKHSPNEGPSASENALASGSGCHALAPKHVPPKQTDDEVLAGMNDVIAGAGGAKPIAARAINVLSSIHAGKFPNIEDTYTRLVFINHLSASDFPNLSAEMLVRGIIPWTIRVLSWLERNFGKQAHQEMAGQCVAACFYILADVLYKGNGPLWAAQALDAGLLPAVLKSAARVADMPEMMSSRCASLLHKVIGGFIIDRPVIRATAKAMRRLDRLDLDDSAGGPIWEAWRDFKTLAQERMSLREEYVHDSEPSRMRCYYPDVRIFGGLLCRIKQLNIRSATLVQSTEMKQTCFVAAAAYLHITAVNRVKSCIGPLTSRGVSRIKSFFVVRTYARINITLSDNVYFEIADGVCTPMTSGDLAFVRRVVIADLNRNAETVDALLVAGDAFRTHGSLSSVAFVLDYCQGPVRISAVPLYQLQDMAFEYSDLRDWKLVTENAAKGDELVLLAEVKVLRGITYYRHLEILPLPGHWQSVHQTKTSIEDPIIEDPPDSPQEGLVTIHQEKVETSTSYYFLLHILVICVTLYVIIIGI
ncbi:hypothetical protein HWV62_4788 [Athelia sp. TMB]|nr:hypothetical protein HWV62_4788 [Athelia sp. TMB]